MDRDDFPNSQQTKNPAPHAQSFGESRFPGSCQILDPAQIFIIFPIPAPYFGQISDPENTLPDPVFTERYFFYFRKGNKQYRLLLNSGNVFTGESNTIFSGGNPTSKPLNTSVIEAHSIPRPCVKRQETVVNISQGYF